MQGIQRGAARGFRARLLVGATNWSGVSMRLWPVGAWMAEWTWGRHGGFDGWLGVMA
jgi:hypothetical protein